jgi:hypothetical protein
MDFEKEMPQCKNTFGIAPIGVCLWKGSTVDTGLFLFLLGAGHPNMLC